MSYNDADDYAGLPARTSTAKLLELATVLRAGSTYTVLATSTGPAIRCHTCTSVSWNANDVERLYCGRCHRFHSGV